MAQEPQPRRGMPRSLIYALIPLGFVLMVVLMLVMGDTADETPERPAPAGTGAAEPPAPGTGTAGSE